MQKTASAVSDANCEIQSKENMLFSGTAIANGTVIGIVVCTGMATEIGHIQSQIQEAADEESETPLKKKLNNFGETLAQVGAGEESGVRCVACTSIIWGDTRSGGWWRGRAG